MWSDSLRGQIQLESLSFFHGDDVMAEKEHSVADGNGNGSAETSLATKISQVGRWQELSDPDAGLPLADRVVNKIAEVLGVLILGAIVGIVFCNACMRYLLNTSIIWAEEVVINIIPWLAVTGLFLAIRRKTVIRIDYFFEKLPAPIQRPLNILSQVLCAAIFAYVGFLGLKHFMVFGRDTTPYLGLPVGIFTISVFFGGVFACLAFIVEIVKSRKE
jgi:TRAP-type C4-dicarboxylate transport system permease small subunit